MLASQYAEDGDLSRFTPQEIADYCDFEGDADSLVEGLVIAKWLDKDADSLRVHDWHDHRPNYLQDRERKRAERGVSRTFQDSPGKSSPRQAKPSHAMPNHAMPSQAHQNADGGDAGEPAGFDFLELCEERYPDVIRQCDAINRTFGKQIDSVELVWQLAWIGIACGEGVIPGCIEKFKKLKGTKDAIKAPQAWLIGCMNRELKSSGIAFDDAISYVVPYSEAKAKVSK